MPATLQQIADALAKADASGNADDARALADAYRQRKAALDAYMPAGEQPQVTGSALDNAVAGFGKSFVDTGRGIQQIYSHVADTVAPRQLGLSDLVTGNDPSRSAAVQKDIDEAKALDRPLMQTGAGIAGNIAGNIAQSVALPVGGAATGAARYAIPAAIGAAQGFIQPVASDESRAMNAGLGGLGGAVGTGVAQGIGKLAQGASQTLSPAVKALAERANDLGIGIRADQLVNSKPLNALSAALDYVPFSGKGAALTKQGEQFNRAISRTVGEDSHDLAVAIPAAAKRLGNEFDRVLTSNKVSADDALTNDLVQVLGGAKSELAPDQYARISGTVDDLLSKVGNDGTIDGRAAYNVKKSLDRIGNSQDTSVAHWAGETKNALMDALNRSLGPDEAAAFAKTRKQYGAMLSLEPMIQAGAEGGITPARLASAKVRLRDGDLQELADIGGQFLKSRVNDSGTAQRLGAMGALGGAGASNPLAAIGAIAAGRGINGTLGSGFARNYLLNGSALLRGANPVANRLLPSVGDAIALENKPGR